MAFREAEIGTTTKQNQYWRMKM